MPIRKLPTLLVNQIAAGEVIERPASVVKELVENSLDAGATRIDIAVEEGGHQLVRISDDGGGIAADELPLAVAPHATSKLETAEQLAAIRTLGFRGEALASIASVSRLRITSRPRDAEAAQRIEVSGDRASEPEPAAAAPGTVIEVRDLFFNTPARRKFMRTASTEFGHINDTVMRLAMVHHTIGFTLSHNGRQSFELPPSDGRARRCVELLGKELAEALLEFELIDAPREDGDDAKRARVWGMAGLPEIARGSGKALHLCVNGRPVRDRNLTHAVREAYRGLIPPDRQPTAVVFIELDPAEVDVNVHPTKAEVRFRNPSKVHGLVLSAMRQRLLGSDLTPEVKMADGGWRMADVKPSVTIEPTSTQAFVDYFRKMDPTQKGFVYQEVKRELEQEQPELLNASDATSDIPHPTSQIPGVRHSPILQVRNSYVVTEDEQGLVIVDQHALHERVMFEELRRRVLGDQKKLESQRLLMPAVIDADTSRQALIEKLAPLLERIGIEVQPIGPSAVAVQAFPSFLFDRKVDPAEFINELLDKAEAGELNAEDATAQEAALHEVLDMMSCKAAVKAGDHLTESELSELLAKRHEVERSSNCPHGRPTTLRLTIKDLEKQFGRT